MIAQCCSVLKLIDCFHYLDSLQQVDSEDVGHTCTGVLEPDTGNQDKGRKIEMESGNFVD
jgi:hypothetical protein